jgi:hypothetical protein
VTVFGRVVEGDAVPAVPLPDAEISIAGDLNADGKVDASELLKTKTDGEGNYRITFEMKGNSPLVATFRAADRLATHARRVISPPGALNVNAVLYTGEELIVEDAVAHAAGGRLKIKGLPSGLTGTARLFNPAFESDAFPGDFTDSTGTRIVSAVFCKVDLRNEGGEEVHELGTTAKLEMEIPQDTWRVIRDVTPGNGRIDVPAYHFDLVLGQWVMEGSGPLVDQDGELIPESAVPAIVGGTYPGSVISVFDVTQFSDWNVDFQAPGIANSAKGKAKVEKGLLGQLGDHIDCKWGTGDCDPPPPPPPPPKEPTKKRKLNEFKPTPKEAYSLGLSPQDTSGSEELVPFTGLSLRAEFFSGDGVPLGHVTGEVGADGYFDFPLGQSEPDGEDLDGNGVAGEKLDVVVMVEYGEFKFHLVEGRVPETAGWTVDMGDVDLTESMLVAQRCEVSGVVQYKDGTPAPEASVWAEVDEWPSDEAFASLCGADGSLCRESALSGQDGTFTIAFPYLQVFRLAADLQLSDGSRSEWYFSNARGFIMCPTEPVTITLGQGGVATTVTISVVGSSISWEPEEAVDELLVVGAESTRWHVRAGSSKIVPPVEFGILPSGAIELVAPQGTIGSGDYVEVTGSSTSAKGYGESIEGFVTLP